MITTGGLVRLELRNLVLRVGGTAIVQMENSDFPDLLLHSVTLNTYNLDLYPAYLRPSRLLITWICGDGCPPSWGWFLTVMYQNQTHGCAQDHP